MDISKKVEIEMHLFLYVTTGMRTTICHIFGVSKNLKTLKDAVPGFRTSSSKPFFAS